ncbi:MAG: class I SAM-dependent methyltransferase [Gammaproteobacteria bacterium]|nr:class I SAM-dependent methyltransferase [Gammaproteobacteria bacterium]
MSNESLVKKWDKHYKTASHSSASRVLLENKHLLPSDGLALEIACGLGNNALLLAEQGLETHAWDISPVGIEQLKNKAQEKGLTIIGEVRDAVKTPPAVASFNVIVVTHFLDRSLMPHLLAALKPQGLLFYQTFIKAKIDDTGPKNPDFLLGNNELLSLCASLHLLVYREEGQCGETTQGFRNLAMLVGQDQPRE